jgi:hypothetical protein
MHVLYILCQIRLSCTIPQNSVLFGRSALSASLCGLSLSLATAWPTADPAGITQLSWDVYTEDIKGLNVLHNWIKLHSLILNSSLFGIFGPKTSTSRLPIHAYAHWHSQNHQLLYYVAK